MENNQNSHKKTARLAGLLYFLWIITGIYGVFYVPAHTIVSGDPAATAHKMVANEFLFRTGIINDIVGNTLWVLIALTLYRLFKKVNRMQAKLLVALVILQVPAVFFMEALNVTSLMLFKGEFLESFDPGRQQELAMLFIKINDHATFVLEMFWGLWLLPFGLLAYKSGFIPRILGILLILNGIAYIIPSFVNLLFPDYQTLTSQIAMPFWILGEISIMLWLLIKGVKNNIPNLIKP